MKHKSVKKITSLLLSGALLAMGTAGIMPAMHASAASNEQTVTDSSTGLKYRFIVNGTNTCTLKRISDNSSDWAMTGHSSVTIPDKIPTTNYTITQLGADNEAIIHSNNENKTRIAALTLPKTVQRINCQALLDGEVPNLKTLKVNVDALTYCDNSAFGWDTALNSIQIYNTTTQTYSIATNTISGFKNYYGLHNANYQACSGDQFKLTDTTKNKKLMFLNATCASPYYKQLAYKYAQNIAQTNGFTSSSLSNQKKLEMIYNYIRTHARYSYIQNTSGNQMGKLAGTPLGVLALNSGVCAGLSYAFEYLCRASGLPVADVAANSDILNVSFPGHVGNAVRMSPNEGFYIVDCTAATFMKNVGYQNSVFSDAFIYGVNTINRNPSKIPFAYSNLNSSNFCAGNSFIKIVNNAQTDIDIEVYDKNNTNAKFINYTAHPTAAVGTTCKPSKFNVTTDQGLYVSSYVYFGIKVGGVVINPTSGSTQNITVNGQTYKVQFQTRSYAQTGMAPQSAYSDYYYLSITRI